MPMMPSTFLLDHGITIMTECAGINLEGDLFSDAMALHGPSLPSCSPIRPPGASPVWRGPSRGGAPPRS